MLDWLENHLFTCYFKIHLGFDCPGCGMQRAFLKLLKGDLIESATLYPPLIPMILMYLILVLHVLIKIKNGAFILKYFFIINILLIFINFTFKLIK